MKLISNMTSDSTESNYVRFLNLIVQTLTSLTFFFTSAPIFPLFFLLLLGKHFDFLPIRQFFVLAIVKNICKKVGKKKSQYVQITIKK